MSLRKYTLYNLAGSILPIAVTFVSVPIYLNLIGEERFGTLAILWSLMTYLGVMNLGLGQAVAQKLASQTCGEQEENLIIWSALLMTILLGVSAGIILWGSADFILTKVVRMSSENLMESLASIKWMAIGMPLVLIESVFSGVLHGKQRFLAMNLLTISGAVLVQIIPLSFAILGYTTIDWLILGLVISKAIVVLLALFYFVKIKLVRLNISLDFEHMRSLVRYGGGVTAISLIVPFLTIIDRILIGNLLGAKFVALYTIPYDIAWKIKTIPTALYKAIFPRLAAAGNDEAMNLAFTSMQYLAVIMGPIALTLIVISHDFLTVWINSDFAERSKGVMEWAILGVWCASLAFPLHAMMLAHSHLKKLFTLYMIEIPFYLGALWFAIAQWGVAGAALTWTFKALIDAGLIFYVNRDLKRSWRFLWKGIIILSFFTISVISLDFDFFGKILVFIVALISLFVSYKEYYVKLYNKVIP